jgi:putative ABC transport system substrate-binding protein
MAGFNSFKMIQMLANCCFKRLKSVLLLLIFSMPLSAHEHIRQIVIVKSNDNAYFNQTVETLVDQINFSTRFIVVTASELDNKQTVKNQQDLFIALGSSAVNAVDKLKPACTRINAYLTQEQYRSLKGKEKENQITLLLDQPLQRYLAFSHLLVPIDSIGVISQAPIELDNQQKSLLKNLNLELNQFTATDSRSLLPTLRELLRENDALLMLPRSMLYNLGTLKGVLLTTYRSRKPVISYSPAHVKSGALASIYASPENIGEHLALVTNGLQLNPDKVIPNLEFARFFSIRTNSRVAFSLGLDLPPVEILEKRLKEIIQ